MIYTAIIEQTFSYPKRMKYIAKTNSFIEKDCDSLSYVRNVRQPYGWIKESGTPTNAHLDVIIMTDREYTLGDAVKIKVIGVFCRNDGDHKLVGVLENRNINDYSELAESEKQDMHRLYPIEDTGEGWFGRERTDRIIDDFFAKKKKKTIITVQHTESQHHINGMIGAWGIGSLKSVGEIKHTK